MQQRLAFMSDPGIRSPGAFARRGGGGHHVARPAPIAAGRTDALLALDIETAPDVDLMPTEWPADRFPKPAWHRVVAVSFVTADIAFDGDGTESYGVTACRSGGEGGWDEARLLRAFWRFFEAGRYRVVTWNGRSFDMPVLLARSMMHGIEAGAWFRRGSKWEGYRHRFALDWHTDLMDAVSDHGAAQRLGLEEAAATLGLPGKLGEHGSGVASLVAAGEIERVRAYCETDCLNLYALYLRWALLTGRTDAGAHDRAVLDLMGFLDRERASRTHLGRFLDAWRATAGDRAMVAQPRRGIES